MKAYYLTIQAWVPNQRDPESQTVKLTDYHTTADGAKKEFKNKFGSKPSYDQLSKRLKVSVPTEMLDKPNSIKIETIDIKED
jgi:hypothetical protein